MAIAVADSWINTGGAPLTVTVSGFSAGELCVVISSSFSNSALNDMGVPTDNGGNTYTERQHTVRDATFRTNVAVSEAVVSTPPTSVGFDASSGTLLTCAIIVLRVTGAAASPYDTSNKAETTVDDPAVPAVTAAATGLVVSSLSHDGADTTLDVPSTWSLAQEDESYDISVGYKVVPAGAVSANWITGDVRDWALVSAIYKELDAATAAAMWVTTL